MTSLNEPQPRAVLAGFVDIHRQLREIEALSAEAGRFSAFSLYMSDVSPMEARVLGDCLAQVRQHMDDYCREEGTPVKVHRTSLRHALQLLGEIQQIGSTYKLQAESFQEQFERLHPDKGQKGMDFTRLGADLHQLRLYCESRPVESTGENLSNNSAGVL